MFCSYQLRLAPGEEQRHCQAEAKSQAKSRHHGGEGIAAHDLHRPRTFVFAAANSFTPLVLVSICLSVTAIFKIAWPPLGGRHGPPSS